jgi:hypothetical protein
MHRGKFDHDGDPAVFARVSGGEAIRVTRSSPAFIPQPETEKIHA